VSRDLLVERDGGYAAREDVLHNLLPLVVEEKPNPDLAEPTP